MANYLCRIYSTLVKVIQKCVHQLILWVGFSYRNWQGMGILEYFNVIYCRLPYFMCDLSKSPVISTFVRKINFWTTWLQFFNVLYSIHWKLHNQYSAVYINIFMQKISFGLFCLLFNIIPSLFSIIYNYLTRICVLWKCNFQWFYKREKINPALEEILIHFEPNYIWFKHCRQHLCR